MMRRMRARIVALLRRLSARDLWERALREHSTPAEIGLAVAIGVFSACTPFLGAHMWIALALATIFRLNRLWAFIGSRFSFLPVFAWVSFCEIEGAHRLRTGSWVPLAPREALAHGSELFADWLVGTVLVGGTLAAMAGLLAYEAARRWKKRVTGRTLAGSPPPSSESPPSAPPTPAP